MASPPITIGELTTVPAPGSPIASPWAQQVSARVVQRFATKAALDSGWNPGAAGKGALAVTVDQVRLWRWDGATWLPVGPAGLVASHVLATTFTTIAPHTSAQDEGLTVTFLEETGRAYKFTASVGLYVPGGPNAIRVSLLRSGVLVRFWDAPVAAVDANTSLACSFTHLHINASGGSATWKLQLAATSANTSISSTAGAQFPRALIVENVL